MGKFEGSEEGRESVPMRSDYGSGCYRRSITLEAQEGRVHAELADDFHHFAVVLRHDERRATHFEGEAIRFPWTTCPGAVSPLRRLEGTPLTLSLAELIRATDARAQCTHLYDLACLTVLHAARTLDGASARRRYEITLPDRIHRATHVQLFRDGENLIEWWIQGTAIEKSIPENFRGLHLMGSDFHEFSLRELDAEIGEAAWILRCAVFIGMGRLYDFRKIHRGRVFASVVGAACHTFDPTRIDKALPLHASLRDFSESPENIFDRES